MGPPLRPPAGKPDRAAARIIASIERYAISAGDTRDEVTVTVGLRHILHTADTGFDAAVAMTRDRGRRWREVADQTGDTISTLQNHDKRHRRRRGREGSPAA